MAGSPTKGIDNPAFDNDVPDEINRSSSLKDNSRIPVIRVDDDDAASSIGEVDMNKIPVEIQGNILAEELNVFLARHRERG